MHDLKLRTKIETVAISLLKPYEDNAKAHPPEQVAEIAEQIRIAGWDQPIVLLLDNTILKGHGRYYAAQLLGLAEVPCIYSELDGVMAMAVRIADNKVAESPWMDEFLRKEMEKIKNLDKEILNSTGFSEKELAALIGYDEQDISKQLKEEKEKETEASDPVPAVKHVRMLQIFLNDETHAEMIEKLVKLQSIYQTTNVTDTFMAVTREIYSLKLENKPGLEGQVS